MNADEAYVLLEAIRDYFDKRADITDSDTGDGPIPNKEMTYKDDCDNILAWLEKMP